MKTNAKLLVYFMTTKEVKKIAQLARIELTNEELETYSRQLSSILTHIDELKELNTDEVPITTQVTGLTNVFQDDVVEKCEAVDEILKQATEMEGGGVKVRSVFE